MLDIQRSRLFILALLLSTEAIAVLPPPLENESPQDYDFRMSAARWGISVAETKRRFLLTEKIGNVEVKLSLDNPDTFAGFWIEETPKKFGLVVQYSGTPKKDISAYMSQELVAITEVRFVTASLADLKKMQIKAITAIRNIGNISFESDIDVKNNRVELYVLERNQLDKMRVSNAIKKSNLKFPKKIVMIKVLSTSSGRP